MQASNRLMKTFEGMLTEYGVINLREDIARRFRSAPRRKHYPHAFDMRFKENKELAVIERQIMDGAKEVWNSKCPVIPSNTR